MITFQEEKQQEFNNLFEDYKDRLRISLNSVDSKGNMRALVFDKETTSLLYAVKYEKEWIGLTNNKLLKKEIKNADCKNFLNDIIESISLVKNLSKNNYFFKEDLK